MISFLTLLYILFQYSITMLILMIAKLTLAILIFVRLDDVIATIPRWLNQAFTNNQQAFHEIEASVSVEDHLKDFCCQIANIIFSFLML